MNNATAQNDALTHDDLVILTEPIALPAAFHDKRVQAKVGANLQEIAQAAWEWSLRNCEVEGIEPTKTNAERQWNKLDDQNKTSVLVTVLCF